MTFYFYSVTKLTKEQGVLRLMVYHGDDYLSNTPRSLLSEQNRVEHLARPALFLGMGPFCALIKAGYSNLLDGIELLI